MQNNVKKKLQSKVLINCLDVLCRANATVFESDPKLAGDITQAIEALSTALQNADQPANGSANSVQTERQPADKCAGHKNNIVPYYSPTRDEIVDVLTNEVIKWPASK